MKRRTWLVLAGLVLAMLLGAWAIVQRNASTAGAAGADQTTVFSH